MNHIEMTFVTPLIGQGTVQYIRKVINMPHALKHNLQGQDYV